MATITKDSIESEAWNNVYAIVNNRSNVPDPRKDNGRVLVHDSDPFNLSLDFSGMPYMILEMPKQEYSKISLDGKHKHVGWQFKITIRTAKEGSSGSRPDTGRKDMFTITDALQKTFNSETIKASLRQLNMFKFNLKKQSSESTSINQKAMYEAIYTLDCETRIQVSD